MEPLYTLDDTSVPLTYSCASSSATTWNVKLSLKRGRRLPIHWTENVSPPRPVMGSPRPHVKLIAASMRVAKRSLRSAWR